MTWKRRKPIKRRTPLKPGGYLKRKKRIRRRSMKQQAHMDATSALRWSAIEYGVTCEGPLCARRAEHPHEITAGPHRKRAMEEPLAQMHLCSGCHDDLQGQPYEKQIAYKVIAIVDAANRCLGSSIGPVNRVCVRKVIKWIYKILKGME